MKQREQTLNEKEEEKCHFCTKADKRELYMWMMCMIWMKGGRTIFKKYMLESGMVN